MSLYVDNFINNTSHFQINDARQTPIVIPTERILQKLSDVFDNALSIKQKDFSGCINQTSADNLLNTIQTDLEMVINKLYAI